LTLDHCRVFGRQLLDAAEGEKELRLKRLFTAESAIVVERGDTLGSPARQNRGSRILARRRSMREATDYLPFDASSAEMALDPAQTSGLTASQEGR